MDEARATRRAALDAVRDVEPAGLSDQIEGWLEQGSMVPGVLTIHCARATSDDTVDGEGSELGGRLGERAAGVQLIYDGLRLTRELAQEEPWAHGEGETANLDVLVADVLVARGFYLLARTGAAAKAVETVRAFGRDQTLGRETDSPSLDRNLEADALELAVIAGADSGTAEVSPQFREFAAEQVKRVGQSESDFPPAAEFFTASDLDRLQGIQTERTSGDGIRTSVDD